MQYHWAYASELTRSSPPHTKIKLLFFPVSSMNLGSKEELFLILRKSPKKRWLFMFGLRDRSQKHACKAYVLPLNHIPGPMSFFSCSLGKKKKLLVLLPPPPLPLEI